MLVSEVTSEMLLEVSEVVKEAENMGLKIEWFNKVIEKILRVKDIRSLYRK